MNKIPIKNLYLPLLVLLAGFVLTLVFTKTLPDPNAVLYQLAADRTTAGYLAIKEEKSLRGIPIDKNTDPRESGMIGMDFSPITTTLADAETKNASVNPDASALITKYLLSLGVKEGDLVAINFSGSFPGINVAVLMACETLNLEYVTISSVGASKYGANLPEFTWQDMEQTLYQSGLIHKKPLYYSHGGAYDTGEGLDKDILFEIDQRLETSGKKLLEFQDFEQNLDYRMKLYQDATVLINAGGNYVSLGSDDEMSFASGGVWHYMPGQSKGDGLIQRFIAQDKPVIQLLNLKDLYHNEIPWGLSPLQSSYTAPVYQTQSVPKSIPIAALALAALIFKKNQQHK